MSNDKLQKLDHESCPKCRCSVYATTNEQGKLSGDSVVQCSHCGEKGYLEKDGGSYWVIWGEKEASEKEGSTLEVVDGKKKVRLENENGCMNLLIMTNGFQWTGAPVNHDSLMMIKDIICKYEVRENNKLKKG